MAMQVIYSAGTSPLSCGRHSPRVERRYHPPARYALNNNLRKSRSMENWSKLNNSHSNSNNDIKNTIVTQRTVDFKHSAGSDKTLKDTIPAMSKPVAIICLICNILFPGLGTFLSGLTVLCCSHVRPCGGTKWNVIWVNTWVGLLQFLTAFLFLLGWIWSIMWGVGLLSISDEYYEENKKKKNVETGLAEEKVKLSGKPQITVEDLSISLLSTNRKERRNTSISLPDSHGLQFPDHLAPIIVLQDYDEENEKVVVLHGSDKEFTNFQDQQTENRNNYSINDDVFH